MLRRSWETKRNLILESNKRILGESKDEEKGKNSPRWKKLSNKLKNINKPYIEDFKDFDSDIPNQSINWGLAQTMYQDDNVSNISTYIMYIKAYNPNNNEEIVYDFGNYSDKKERNIYFDEVKKWWNKKGYEVDSGDSGTTMFVKINFDDVEKLTSDVKQFLVDVPPF
jgi:hypothetical protein